MLLFVIFAIVSLIGNLWVVSKIWPVSKLYAVASFIFFPAAIFFMFANWGDEEHDIKVPFVITLIAGIATIYQLDQLADQYGSWEEEEEESRLYDGRYDLALDVKRQSTVSFSIAASWIDAGGSASRR